MTDTVELPAERVGEMARQQALLDSDPVVLAAECADVEKWSLIESAPITNVHYEDDNLHVWLKTTTTLSKRVAKATRHQPAEYENTTADVHVTIVWSMDPEKSPNVELEVLAQ